MPLERDIETTRIRSTSLLALLLLLPVTALAQQGGGIVSFGSASGAPGTTVAVGFEFDNTEGADGLEARARIQGIDAFTEVDVSALCESASALAVSCILNDDNRILVTAANPPGVPLESFSGSILFSISPDVSESTVVPIEWNAPEDDGLTFTPSEAIDGQVSIVSDGPQFSLSPSSLDFTGLEVGETGPPQAVEVSNSGDADGLVIGDVSLASPDFSVSANGCAGAVLAPSESCSIEVVFTPTLDGALAGTLAIASNVGSRSVALAGTGTAARLDATPAPQTLDFGVVPVGESESIEGQFANSGTAPLDVSCQLASTASDFQIEPNPLVFTDIPPAGSVDFLVTFAPTGDQAQSTALECDSNAIDAPQFQYMLSAPGLSIFSDRFEP